jgi:D-alanyl-D-alanine carboxypeptidase
MLNSQQLDRLLDSQISKNIPGVVLALENPHGRYLGARGNFNPDSQFFIASATKLYITALILQLVDAQKLKLQDLAIQFLSPEHAHGLHVFNQTDYSKQITIQHLLSHTSGLPDYFQAPRSSKKSLLDQIVAGEDQFWSLEKVLIDSKKIGAVFAPDSGKALYSDTNYQILGAVIEALCEMPLAKAIDTHICKKLGLSQTYLYQDPADTRPVPLNYKKNPLLIPKAMTSFAADGGIVSTANEGIDFLKGFFDGKLFSPNHLEFITSEWRSIFYPLKYGVGISLFRLPWYFSPFKKVPDLIGHSGLSGAFLFYCPEKKTYLAGTVNQIAQPQTSFRLMISAILSL